MTRHYLDRRMELDLYKLLQSALIPEGELWRYADGQSDVTMRDALAEKFPDRTVHPHHVSCYRQDVFGKLAPQPKPPKAAGDAEVIAALTVSNEALGARVAALESEHEALGTFLAALVQWAAHRPREPFRSPLPLQQAAQ